MKRNLSFLNRRHVDRLKKHPKAPKPLVPKNLGLPLVGKLDHWISPEHIELVKAQSCIVSRYIGPEVEAHHARELFLRGMGRRRSDFICVPIRKCLHDPDYPGSLHHTGNGAAWWREQGVDPLRWLRGFLMLHYSPGEHLGVDEAIAMINQRIGAGI